MALLPYRFSVGARMCCGGVYVGLCMCMMHVFVWLSTSRPYFPFAAKKIVMLYLGMIQSTISSLFFFFFEHSKFKSAHNLFLIVSWDLLAMALFSALRPKFYIARLEIEKRLNGSFFFADTWNPIGLWVAKNFFSFAHACVYKQKSTLFCDWFGTLCWNKNATINGMFNHSNGEFLSFVIAHHRQRNAKIRLNNKFNFHCNVVG